MGGGKRGAAASRARFSFPDWPSLTGLQKSAPVRLHFPMKTTALAWPSFVRGQEWWRGRSGHRPSPKGLQTTAVPRMARQGLRKTKAAGPRFSPATHRPAHFPSKAYTGLSGDDAVGGWDLLAVTVPPGPVKKILWRRQLTRTCPPQFFFFFCLTFSTMASSTLASTPCNKMSVRQRW